jgi:hypothetical protein
MASIVIRAESAGANYLYSEIVDASTLASARAKARRRLAHWDANTIVAKSRVDSYEYWTVVESAQVETWRENTKCDSDFFVNDERKTNE